MFRYILSALILLSFGLKTIAKSPSDNILKTVSYNDKLTLGKDLLEAAENMDIPKLKTISKALTLPYPYFKDITSTVGRQDNSPENKTKINLLSKLGTDSTVYKNFASDFYFGNLVNAVLNQPYSKKSENTVSYFITNKTDEKHLNKNPMENLIIIYASNNAYHEIALEKLIHYAGNIYTLSQANFYTYTKNELPEKFNKLSYKNINVFKYSNNNFIPYSEETLSFIPTTEPEFSKENQPAIAETAVSNPTEFDNTNVLSSDEEILEFADEMPSYSGGVKALNKFIKENLGYPKQAVKNKREGSVIVKFIVEKNGSIKDPFVVKDNVGFGCAEEALKLVKKMPKWWPGKQNGKPVRVYYTLPIYFKLID